jgi:hypothetical protein
LTVLHRLPNGFQSGSGDFRGRIENLGLGGVRTHNQRLKRALFSIFNILVVRHLELPCFLLLHLLLSTIRFTSELLP